MMMMMMKEEEEEVRRRHCRTLSGKVGRTGHVSSAFLELIGY
jgi:hypothetical protein